MEFLVLFFVEILYIKSKVTQDHSETINLFSMWNNSNDATYTHKYYLQDNMFWLFAKKDSHSRRRSVIYFFLYFSGIYWRAISYFREFFSLKPARKEIRNNLFYKIRERASKHKQNV